MLDPALGVEAMFFDVHSMLSEVGAINRRNISSTQRLE